MTATLRPYQQRAIDQLYEWFESHDGHPCLVLPTGSGKSHIVAALCKDAVTSWPETRILMLTHQKELIEQNAAKLREHWPGAPMGIYSASIGRRELGEPITFAGIQSVRKRAADLGHVDLVIIDECHLVNHRDEGGYRTLLGELERVNPRLRVVGLTATPYRLGHGLITDEPAVFDALLEPVSIQELVFHGHLAPLRSKVTQMRLDATGVAKRGGEYVEAELQRAMDTSDKNAAVVREVMRLAGERRSWLFFCCGVDHAQNVADVLVDYGIAAACVTGETPKGERARLLEAFKRGELRALTNANVLTTGFDAPNVDLIAMLRPTLSPSLYVQMAGRGMRKKEHVADCLVLDFAGVVATHGPITAIEPPTKAGEKTGEAPVKVCDGCGELVHPTARTCPACGFEFPAPPEKKFALRNDDIMGGEGSDLIVSEWEWKRHTSTSSGREMLRVRYYGGLADPPVDEYVCIMHEGYAGEKARRTLARIATDAGLSPGWSLSSDLDEIARALNAATPPSVVTYEREGKFFKVKGRTWSNSEA